MAQPKSKHPISGEAKVERYEWALPGDKGKQCSLPIADLFVDHSYQRGMVSERNTLSIARDFSWASFGSLVVMERKDGRKYVVDGQQRLGAAKRRGDITHVPCILFESEGRDHEAKAFLSLNTCRKCVVAVVKFYAASKAGMEPEKEISSWLANNGLRVTERGLALDGVDFPTTLLSLWEKDKEASKSAILGQREINGTEALHSYPHKGIWWLEHNGIRIADHVLKLRSMGGRVAMLSAIRSLSIEMDSKISEIVAGKAILKMINFRRRKDRVEIPERKEK